MLRVIAILACCRQFRDCKVSATAVRSKAAKAVSFLLHMSQFSARFTRARDQKSRAKRDRNLGRRNGIISASHLPSQPCMPTCRSESRLLSEFISRVPEAFLRVDVPSYVRSCRISGRGHDSAKNVITQWQFRVAYCQGMVRSMFSMLRWLARHGHQSCGSHIHAILIQNDLFVVSKSRQWFI